MDRKLYERECLIRSPQFRRDLVRLQQEYPEWFTPSPTRGGLTKADWEALQPAREALKAFEIKYFPVTEAHVSHVIQPAPFVFDPAWKVCVDNAVVDYLCEHEIPPRGLITRGGVEPPAEPGPEAEEVYEKARAAFKAMPEEDRAMYREEYGPVIFRAEAIYVPSGQAASKDMRRHLAAHLRRAKAARHGTLSPKRAARRDIYEDRLEAYDLVRGRGLTISEAAKCARKPPRMFLRRFHEALKDIEGLEGTLTPEKFRDHVASCQQCQEAEEKGRSDYYCQWMQRRFGGRSGRTKGATRTLDEADRERGQLAQRGRGQEEGEEGFSL